MRNSGKLQMISQKFQNSGKLQNNTINDVKQASLSRVINFKISIPRILLKEQAAKNCIKIITSNYNV